jgi:hypothetical protein
MAASAAVPVLGSLVKKILPDNMFGDIIGGLLDKPQISTPPDPIINKVQGPLSPGEGPEYLETYNCIQVSNNSLIWRTLPHPKMRCP